MKKLLILLLLFPLMMFSQDSTLIGDVDCSGEVNSQDASLILQFVTNVIDTLPCEANMTGLTPEQLQEMIDMIEDQLSININSSCSSFGNAITEFDIEMNYDTYTTSFHQFDDDGFIGGKINCASPASIQVWNDTTSNYVYKYTTDSQFNGTFLIPIRKNQFWRIQGTCLDFEFFVPLQCEDSTTTPNNNTGSNNKTLMYTIDGF